MTDTKKTLTTAHKNFAKYPSATHWRALESAMLAHQAAWQATQSIKIN
jgi:predicted lipoprotein